MTTPHNTTQVPTEAEIAECMAAVWDNPGFTSTRTANGYPKMARAIREMLLARAASCEGSRGVE